LTTSNTWSGLRLGGRLPAQANSGSKPKRTSRTEPRSREPNRFMPQPRQQNLRRLATLRENNPSNVHRIAVEHFPWADPPGFCPAAKMP
jgi:hypothetical protein